MRWKQRSMQQPLQLAVTIDHLSDEAVNGREIRWKEPEVLSAQENGWIDQT